MQEIKASEFKARCLRLMDDVNRSGEPLVITKNGTPVSILMPYKNKPPTLLGLHKGQIKSTDDLVAQVDEEWDADVVD